MLRKTHGLIPPISPSEHVKTHARIAYCTTYILSSQILKYVVAVLQFCQNQGYYFELRR